MTALEHRIDHLGLDLRAEIRAGDEETRRVLREEMRTGHVMIVTELTEQIEDSRRYTRLLHEDVLGRIRVIGEGLRVQTEKIAGQDERITTLCERMTTLSDKIDAARGETRLMFEQVFLRLDAPRTKPKRNAVSAHRRSLSPNPATLDRTGRRPSAPAGLRLYREVSPARSGSNRASSHRAGS